MATTTECPDCGGDGRFETWDNTCCPHGEETVRYDECETCHGEGEVEVAS